MYDGRRRHPSPKGGGSHQLKRFATIGGAAVVLAIGTGVVVAQSASAWETSTTASVSCSSEGTAVISGTFVNKEQKSSCDMNVTMTAGSQSDGPKRVNHQSSKNFSVDTGQASVSAGHATFEEHWVKGSGSDSVKANYDALDCTPPPTTTTTPASHKVWVCKYSGTPGVDEKLKPGKNPISVDASATDGTGVGGYFNDAQGRSFVLAIDDGGSAPDVSGCPAPEGPPPTTSTPPPANPVGTSSASCATAGSVNVTVTGSDFPPGNTYLVRAKVNGVSKEIPANSNDAGDLFYPPTQSTNFVFNFTGVPANVKSGTWEIEQILKGIKASGSFDFNCAPAPKEVTPAEPTVTKASCDNTDVTVTVTDQEGVVYSPKGNIVLKPGDSVTVKATPADGYTFPDGAKATWSFTNDFNPATCTPPDVVVTVPGLSTDSGSCFNGGKETVTPIAKQGVVWSPGGATVLEKFQDNITYTASPAKGYKFANGSKTVWYEENHFNYNEECAPETTPPTTVTVTPPTTTVVKPPVTTQVTVTPPTKTVVSTPPVQTTAPLPVGNGYKNHRGSVSCTVSHLSNTVDFTAGKGTVTAELVVLGSDQVAGSAKVTPGHSVTLTDSEPVNQGGTVRYEVRIIEGNHVIVLDTYTVTRPVCTPTTTKSSDTGTFELGGVAPTDLWTPPSGTNWAGILGGIGGLVALILGLYVRFGGWRKRGQHV
jgi:hypothetical protein